MPLPGGALLSEILTPERVRVPLDVADKHEAIRELTRLLVEQAGGDFADVLAAVKEREEALSTGIGFGVAIPHGKSPTLSELCVVAGVTAGPIPFEAIDGQPVRLVFLVAGPESSAGMHVRTLSRIARLVRHENVRDRLVAARSPSEFCSALADAESR